MPAALRFLAPLLLAAIPAAAQDKQVPISEAPLTTLRITVTLIQVDVVVTDSKGRRVLNLSPDDFELRQDGEVEKITYFSYIPEPQPSEEARDSRAPVAPMAPLPPTQVRRTVALVVDDLALPFEGIVRVRESLRKYVQQHMRPGDLAAIIRTGGGVAILEQFTADKRILLAATDLLKWRYYGRSGFAPINPIATGASNDGAAPRPQVLDYSATLSALGALGTIEQVVRGMKNLPGRKSVVFFSDALRMEPAVNSAIDRLTDLSNRSAVSLYTIDPGGLKADWFDKRDYSAEINPASGSILGGLADDLGRESLRPQEGLIHLAKRTGGLFFADNDIPGSIRKALDDQLGYYLIGYSPQAGTFERDPQKAKFRRISVRVRRPGLQARWKTGFTGLPDELTSMSSESAPKTPEQQLLEALASPFAATGLKVRLTSMYLESLRSGPFIHSMLHFDGKDLSFTQDADGAWRAAVDVVTSAFHGVKQPIQQWQRRENIRLSDDLYHRALKEGFLLNVDHPMKQPGTFLMRAVVRDAASEKIGSASQSIQVPDTRKGQLAVSGIMLQLAPAELASGQPAAPGVGQDGKVEAWVEGGPAVRRYRPGQSLLYSFMVINPKLKGSTKKPDFVSQIRVFRNGKLIFSGNPAPVVEQGRLDARRYAGAGILRLGSNLTQGEYLVQVVVTDRLASKKKSQVEQWIDFEVTAGPSS